MPGLYAAFRTDEGGTGQRVVRGSQEKVKGELRKMPGTTWSIMFYSLRADVSTMCALMEDYALTNASGLLNPAGTPEYVKVNEQGQVRKI